MLVLALLNSYGDASANPADDRAGRFGAGDSDYAIEAADPTSSTT